MVVGNGLHAAELIYGKPYYMFLSQSLLVWLFEMAEPQIGRSMYLEYTCNIIGIKTSNLGEASSSFIGRGGSN